MMPGCLDCGVDYRLLGLDVVLPDQQWKLLCPERDGGGILCPDCISKRAAVLGGTAILCWVDNMDYSLDYQKAKEALDAEDVPDFSG